MASDAESKLDLARGQNVFEFCISRGTCMGDCISHQQQHSDTGQEHRCSVWRRGTVHFPDIRLLRARVADNAHPPGPQDRLCLHVAGRCHVLRLLPCVTMRSMWWRWTTSCCSTWPRRPWCSSATALWAPSTPHWPPQRSHRSRMCCPLTARQVRFTKLVADEQLSSTSKVFGTAALLSLDNMGLSPGMRCTADDGRQAR